jgi:predicted nicotinamide N-methyase
MALPGRGRFLLHLAAAAGGASVMGIAAGTATVTQAEVDRRLQTPIY